MSEKVVFTWSGGKDSALALYMLRKMHNYEIVALLTSVTKDYDRISMHGVRRVLLEQQAQSLGLPLEILYITRNSSNEEYETKLKEKLLQFKSQGVSSVVFGDIFLEDVRRYRESNLARVGMNGIFPLWKRGTSELAHDFIDLDFKAVITCVDSNVLDGKLAGRYFDNEFLSELPSSVDPCGENGEFHTFVYDGPIFSERIRFRRGKVVLKDNRFYFCDLIPVRKLWRRGKQP